MGFAKFLYNKLKFRRLALNTGVNKLTYGAIYAGTYSQWKHDIRPNIFIMYSDEKYTHAINVNYLTYSDKMWLQQNIYMIKRSAQNLNAITLYRMIKMRRKSIIDIAYRVYFTNLLNMKLVSAGLTYLDKITYTTRDPWINNLNEMIKPVEIGNNMYTPHGISYNSSELSNRITQAINTVDIRKNTVYGKAKWMK